MPSKNILLVRNLSVQLGSFSLKDVSFGVKKGEYCCLLGASGAGKSVLLETVIGAFRPQQGKVFLHGKDVTSQPPERRRLGIVYQDYMLFPHLNVYKNIAFGLQGKGISREIINERVHELAKHLRIEDLLKRDIATLSGGEQQRTALARALITKPEILLMDEAFSALDVATRESMRLMLKNLVKKLNITVLHVTHDMEDVWALATHVAVIHDGTLLQEGSPEDVFRRPRPGYVAHLVGAKNIIQAVVTPSVSGLTELDAQGQPLYIPQNFPPGTGVTLSVRPEDIIVAREKVAATSMNQIPVTVSDIMQRGPLVWITGTREGMKLQAMVTMSGFQSLGLEKGMDCVFFFKASSLEVLENTSSQTKEDEEELAG